MSIETGMRQGVGDRVCRPDSRRWGARSGLGLPGLRRPVWLAAPAVLGLAAAVVGLRGFQGAEARTWAEGINVVLISLDTVRKDHLSCYGYARETTPHLDALAGEGLLFRRCVAVSNWTLPTHASMLSGLYPSTHGAHLLRAETPSRRTGSGLAPAGAMHSWCESLAEVLGGHGYRSAAIVANALYLQKAHGLDQGFDWYDDRCVCPACRKAAPGTEPSVPYRRAAEITDEAIGWIGRDRTKPFFLFLNYMDAHEPYFPPAPYDTRFEGDASGGTTSGAAAKRRWSAELNWYQSWRDQVVRYRTPPPPEVSTWLRGQYDGEISYLDAQLGRLFEYLRAQGLYERSLIVVTSDHGESFGEHGLMAHGLSLYESEVAVPMIVKLPLGRRGGEQIAEGVQHVDVMPTVLEVLEVATPAGVQGQSMLHARSRDLFVEQYVNAEHARVWPQFNRRQWALYRGDLKLIEYGDGSLELYDLGRDPEELENLVDAGRGELASLREALRGVREAVLPVSAAEAASDLRADSIEQLRDLGYAH